VAVGAVYVGEREQGQPPAALEELVAVRIAAEAVRIAEERIREMFETTRSSTPTKCTGSWAQRRPQSSWVSPTPPSGRSPLTCPGTP
jgi:hypothetical protein